MDRQSRVSIGTLQPTLLPLVPGVYALYRDDVRHYVGKAASLRQRIWNNHCGRGRVMTGSAMRRNIAQHLGIATATDIKARRYQPTDSEVVSVRAWLEGCEIAWLECRTPEEALTLETALKHEHMPPLTRI